MPCYKITINDMRLWVRLGCSNEEKAQVQPITLNITLYMANMLPGCRTDALQDTYCYQDISERVELAIASKSFNLIEHLGMAIWEAVRVYLDEAEIEGCPAKLQVCVTKLNPPIPGLHGGVSFSYCDGGAKDCDE